MMVRSTPFGYCFLEEWIKLGTSVLPGLGGCVAVDACNKVQDACLCRQPAHLPSLLCSIAALRLQSWIKPNSTGITATSLTI